MEYLKDSSPFVDINFDSVVNCPKNFSWRFVLIFNVFYSSTISFTAKNENSTFNLIVAKYHKIPIPKIPIQNYSEPKKDFISFKMLHFNYGYILFITKKTSKLRNVSTSHFPEWVKNALTEIKVNTRWELRSVCICLLK